MIIKTVVLKLPKFYAVALFSFFSIVASHIQGQTGTISAESATLPSAAQEALNKGMSAARQKEWDVAIRYFNDARQAAPASPLPFVNLGLAEAQIPGRELRAICWLETYLALLPDAANAAAVREKISDLEIRAEGNVRKMIGILKQLAAQFPAKDSYGISAIKSVADILAKSGDLDGVQAVIESLPSDDRDSARENVVTALAQLNRFADALKFTSQIGYDRQYVTHRSDAYRNVAASQMEAGLFADARQSIDNMTQSPTRVRSLTQLAEAQFKAGKKEEALATLNDARTLTAGVKERDHFYALVCLAEGQGKLGQNKDALDTFRELDPLLPKKASESNNSEIHTVLEAHITAGDIAGAQALLPRLIDSSGFAYHANADKSIKSKQSSLFEEEAKSLQELIKTENLIEIETATDKATGKLARSMGYFAVANALKKANNIAAIAPLKQKSEALYSSELKPLNNIVVASRNAQIAAMTGDSEGARRWWAKALEPDNFKAALQNPKDYLTTILYDNYYYSTGVTGNVVRLSLATDDKSTVSAAIKAAKTALRQLKADDQFDFVVAILWHYWEAKDFDSDVSFIESIPDSSLSKQAFDKHYEMQFRHRLETNDLAGAAKLLPRIGDAPAGKQGLSKSDISDLWTMLLKAQADMGDWSLANQTLAKIMDPAKRQTARAYIVSAQVTGGEQDEKSKVNWEERRAKLATLATGSPRLGYYWSDLCGFPNVEYIAEQREMAAAFLAEALVTEKAHFQQGALQWPELAGARLGLFDVVRSARAALSSSFLADPSSGLSALGWVLPRMNVADILELASSRWRDEMLARAIQRLVADGNSDAAKKIVNLTAKKPSFLVVQNWIVVGDLSAAEQTASALTDVDADKANKALVDAFIAAGNLTAARSACERIAKDVSGNDSARSYATRELVKAWVKAGDLATAKSFVEQTKKLRDNESVECDTLAEIGAGGDPVWAQTRANALSYAPNRYDALSKIVGVMAAHSNDAALAKETLKSMREVGQDYRQYQLIDAVLQAGNLKLALQLTPEILMSSRAYQFQKIAAAFTRANDLASAQAAVAGISSNPDRFTARANYIAPEQIKAGDIEGARATLIEARKLDPRTSKNLDVDSWAGYQIAYSLAYNTEVNSAKVTVYKPKINDAKAEADKIQSPYWRDLAMKVITSAKTNFVVNKDPSAVIAELSAMSDETKRSMATYDLCVAATDPIQALAYLDLISDAGYQTTALGALLNKFISRMDVSAVLPRVLALPDGAAKAYLLSDVLRAQVFLGLDPKSPSLLPDAIKATNAMPPNVWQVLLLSDLAHLSKKLDPNQSAEISGLVTTKVQALTDKDAAIWKQFLADTEARKSLPAQVDASGSPINEKAKAWSDFVNISYSSVKGKYVNGDLNKPIFTDFSTTLTNLANSVPEKEDNRAWKIFSNYAQQAEAWLEKLKNMRAMREMLQKSGP